MVRARGAVVVRAVAADTVRWRPRITAADVTVGARSRAMVTREREHRIVVETARGPRRRRRAVAARTVRAKAGRRVARARGAVVVRTVAANTIRRRPRETAAAVTVRARSHAMVAREREHPVVIERGRGPCRRRRAVAARTVRAEAGRRVARARGALVICTVAANTIRRRPHEQTIRMTFDALERTVRSVQRVHGVVIELSSEPRDRVDIVAFGTIVRKAHLDVIRITRCVELGAMAIDALTGRAQKLSVHVT